jgi:predicted lipid-binding transport protein (Tim44 family)
VPAESPSPVLPGRSRPARRRATGPGPGRPARPGQGRLAAPAPERAAGPPPPQGAGAQAGAWVGASSAAIARTPFIVFVTALLGGGLICLLVINTILATGSYQITSLQQAQAARAQQVQALKEQVAEEAAPSVIAKRARQLGMVEPPLTKFLNLKTGHINSQPATEPGVPAVPGYTP